MGGYGTTLHSPWPLVMADDSAKWNKSWPTLAREFSSIDPLQEAADFYLCEGIAHNAFVSIKPLRLPDDVSVRRAAEILGLTAEDVRLRQKRVDDLVAKDPRVKLTALSEKADRFLTAQVERLDQVFVEYVHMACGGELRHHRAIGGSCLSSSRNRAWANWKDVVDNYGIDALLTAAELFREFGGGSYGSEKWAVAAELLHQRLVGTLGPNEFLNKKLFVDRVFTLEHNGGCFLNKLEWTNNREYDPNDSNTYYHWDLSRMKNMLDFHHQNPPNIKGLYSFASSGVKTLVYDYMKLAKSHGLSINGNWTMPKTEPVPTQPAAKKVSTTETLQSHTYGGTEYGGWKANIEAPMALGHYDLAQLTQDSVVVQVEIDILDASGEFVDTVTTKKKYWNLADLAEGQIIYPKMLTKAKYPGLDGDSAAYYMGEVRVVAKVGSLQSVYAMPTKPKQLHCNSLAYNLVQLAIAQAE